MTGLTAGISGCLNCGAVGGLVMGAECCIVTAVTALLRAKDMGRGRTNQRARCGVMTVVTGACRMDLTCTGKR